MESQIDNQLSRVAQTLSKSIWGMKKEVKILDMEENLFHVCFADKLNKKIL